MTLLMFHCFRTQCQSIDLASMQIVSSNSCATQCSGKYHVSMHTVCVLNVLKKITCGALIDHFHIYFLHLQ